MQRQPGAILDIISHKQVVYFAVKNSISMAGMYTGSSAVAKGSNPHPHGRRGREKHTPGARNSQNPANTPQGGEYNNEEVRVTFLLFLSN